MRRYGVAVLLLWFATGCARSVEPAALDTGHALCGFCRMAVSDTRFAAQIAEPGGEPIFFDDIGCLRDYLRQTGEARSADAVAFVTDHRSGAWVRAAAAVYTRTSLSTPMGSGIIAHADPSSRDKDPAAAGGAPVATAALFGPAGPPDGAAR